MTFYVQIGNGEESYEVKDYNHDYGLIIVQGEHIQFAVATDEEVMRQHNAQIVDAAGGTYTVTDFIEQWETSDA